MKSKWKTEYLSALMHSGADWVKRSYEQPNKYMLAKPMHMMLHRLAYRKLTGEDLV